MNKRKIFVIITIIVLIAGVYVLKRINTYKKQEERSKVQQAQEQSKQEEQNEMQPTQERSKQEEQNEVQPTQEKSKQEEQSEVQPTQKQPQQEEQNEIKQAPEQSEPKEKNEVQEIVEQPKEKEQNQSEQILETAKEKYTLYDFGFEGCYYCGVMEPIVNKYKNSYSNITFKTIDIYEDTSMANKYKIQYAPTFVIVDSKGNEIERKTGAMGESEFKSFVEKYS